MFFLSRKRVAETFERRIQAAENAAEYYMGKGDNSAAGRWESIAFELESVRDELLSP